MADTRPTNCRFRLQDEGKAYPRSSCKACGKHVFTGLGRECSHQSPAAPDAALVRVKPLAWEGFVAGNYRIEVEKGGIANLWHYSAAMVEDEEPTLIKGGYLTLVSLDELKAAAQADHEARILAALEPAPAPALVAELVEALRVTRERLLSNLHSEFDGVWTEQDFLDEVKEADAVLAKLEGKANG